MNPVELSAPRLRLRALSAADIDPLLALLTEPVVARFWPGYDRARIEDELLAEDDERLVLGIELRDAERPIIGAIQLVEDQGAEYRHAGIDLFIGTAWQGRGLGSEAIRTAVDFLFKTRKHHRITIDPAADNHRAIRTYEQLGFRRVGLLRQYERGADGTYHDGLLLELLACDHRDETSRVPKLGHCTLRMASAADVALLVPMVVSFNRFEGIDWNPQTGEPQLRKLLQDERLGFVALFETEFDAICGYAVVSYGFDLEFGGRDGFLTEIYLDAAVRGRGLGTQALGLVLQKARECGVNMLHLQVRPDNPQAQRLYLSAGFVPTTRIFLSKPLSGS